ncbi:MAG: DNA cytosine methyltransferase, partial [bacterium]
TEHNPEPCFGSAGLADTRGERGRCGQPRREDAANARQSGEAIHPGPVNGFWRSADWLYCRDDKWRPAEPGTFPLAHGAPARVGRLRGYGNAVDAEATRAFIEAYLETRTEVLG